MPSNQAARQQALFAAALDLPESERKGFLERECAGDDALLTRLNALLAADAHTASKTVRPIVEGMRALLDDDAAQSSLRGMRVGAYVLREELGRGGMGCVYRAERADGAVAQQVAIKLVRRELRDAETLRRFRLERELLARLSHPSIARLIDAAQLEDGTPYYVMEYVDGANLIEFCARADLDVRARVALMRRVCAAVAAAHRSLVVHRDLKPGNVLVEADGAPKLLDFGIAKLLDTEDGAGHQTGTAQRYFSPHYAAPEQLTGGAIGVGCDVYGLGLLLYECLAGAPPFDLGAVTAGQAERLVTQVPPEAPSAVAARSADSAVHSRARQLRGDLDDIVLRCLRKAPAERYASVEQVEADLGNYLEGRPVEARGGHRWYRAQKFVRRNLGAVIVGSLFGLSLLVGIVAFAWQARIARERAAELEQVTAFQAQMLAQVDPTRAGALLVRKVKGKHAEALAKTKLSDDERATRTDAFAQEWGRVNPTDTARELIEGTILAPASEAIGKQFKDRPLIEATLSATLAERYRQIGLYDAAQSLQRRALEIRQRLLGADHPDTLAALNDMGELYLLEGKHAEAERYYREALEKRRRVLGPAHPDTLASLDGLGRLLKSQTKYADAETLFREVVAGRRRMLGDDHKDTFAAIGDLSDTLLSAGKLDEATPLVRDALERSRRLFGTDHQTTQVFVGLMGSIFFAQDRFAEAEPYYREVLESRRRVLGEDHLLSLGALTTFAAVVGMQGRDTEAYFREALEKYRRFYGNEHPGTLRVISNLGVHYERNDRLDEAERYFREAFEIRRRVLGDEDQFTIRNAQDLSSVMVRQKRFADALELLTTFEPHARAAYTGANVRGLWWHLHCIGQARSGLGQFRAAETTLLEAHTVLEQMPKPMPDDLKHTREALAELYTAWNQAERGKGYESKAAEWKRRAQSP